MSMNSESLDKIIEIDLSAHQTVKERAIIQIK